MNKIQDGHFFLRTIWLTVIKEAVGLNLSENIAEGSQVSATSKKLELKLTQVTRASLEELRLVYEDFPRQKKLALWEREEPL